MKYCGKSIPSRSKYDKIQPRKCHLPENHKGKCEEFPFLKDLTKSHKRVSDKIKRDSTMTTGAAWKSDDAGPNRILRWVMLLNDEELLKYGIDISALKPQVVSKIKEKGADYDSCIQVAIKLTWLAYQMPGAPDCSQAIKEYLIEHFGELKNETVCSICLDNLPFDLFHSAQRGKANIETCHLNPRIHNSENVGFAHRECNIAQGNKTLEEFYEWIAGILDRANKS
ncbi:hypothetical protein MATR_04340 [Marivirga tractuosa]|uniref:Uncharacterized protein n=1 Tax=Marivirga tractuosa (strain ATCC 23168 / DSM 4126 / NBRC 15989 / NCIMB 1408 / VKM B-1430 / H-43) TaxID=643867 RepID=E4TTA2_MARTH|nr:hypothetical protein [Marivirga tractuosa]ADR21932.1 hypothetical protein Ftrac_1947 [Marivirga tractuosa DSM 4126]BDD13609.1 hypothetical protein MATR_04340 [Marivirga tractuosa]